MGSYFFIPKFLVTILLTGVMNLSFFPSIALAESTNVLINEVQTGGLGSGTATEEFIELYNSGGTTIDLTNWRLEYSSYTDITKNEIAVIDGQLPPNGHLLLVSNSYMVPEGTTPDLLFGYNGGMSGTGGHIKLIDDVNNERDRLGWGTAQFAETASATAPAGGFSSARINSQDSDNNYNDFAVSTSPSPKGGDLEESGPTNQPTEPVIYPTIEITELLPDPASPKLDDEDEFIEIYNPNDETVLLIGYVLQTGSSYQYSYTLPAFVISANEYLALYSSETNLVLSNSGGQARILDPNGEILNSSDEYLEASEDNSWALIDEVWRTTNQLTPGAANKPNLVLAEQENSDQTIEPCPDGKYRNPLTNRCKSVESGLGLKPCAPDQSRNPSTNRCKKSIGESPLTPCAPGQYRNPETNRCRKTSSSTGLKPCNDDQYRNPLTNRCKKKDAMSSLVPCQEGQERSAETNRCQKVAGLATGALSNPATVQTKSNYKIIAIIALLATGYGIFEYRQEIRNFVTKVFSKTLKKP